MIRLVKPTVPKLARLASAYNEVLDNGMLTNGKYVEKFEQNAGHFLGNENTTAVANATAGMILAAKLLNLKGEVILPSFTYSSTGHALLWNNIKPVFADIDRETFNLDPADVERKITNQTSAICPVHCFGNPVEIEKIEKLGKKYKLKIIYDAAHAFGSKYRGKSPAKFGDAAIYSFTPTKVLTCGEGGLVVVKDKNLAAKAKIGRDNGDSFNRKEEFLGLTSRMTEFNAILGIENLKKIQKELKKRNDLARYYKRKLEKIRGVTFQKINPQDFSVNYCFAIILPGKKLRDGLLAALHKNNIQSKTYFYPPLHKKIVYLPYAKKTNLPNTEWVADRIICLPFYTTMPKREIDIVCGTIEKFVKLNLSKLQ